MSVRSAQIAEAGPSMLPQKGSITQNLSSAIGAAIKRPHMCNAGSVEPPSNVDQVTEGSHITMRIVVCAPARAARSDAIAGAAS